MKEETCNHFCDLINFDMGNYKCSNCGQLLSKGIILNNNKESQMKKQLTIKEYYKIARISNEVELQCMDNKVLKITDDFIYFDRDGVIDWEQSDEITLIKQAKPDWDNLRAGDEIVSIDDFKYKVTAVFNNTIGYTDDDEVIWNTKEYLQELGFTIKDTREDKEEEQDSNKVYIRNHCECGCDCPTCHLSIGEKGKTEVENCVYCQLKWAGKDEYDPKYRKKHGMKPLKEFKQD